MTEIEEIAERAAEAAMNSLNYDGVTTSDKAVDSLRRHIVLSLEMRLVE